MTIEKEVALKGLSITSCQLLHQIERYASSLLEDDNAETIDITTVAGHQEVSDSLREIIEVAMRVRAEVGADFVAAATK